MNQTVKIEYAPRPFQRMLHSGFARSRLSLVICHRRAGKTVACVAETIRQVLRCKLPEPQGAYIAPTYGMAKRIAWNYFKGQLANVPGVTFREGELSIELPGKRRIYLLGADSPDRLRGMYLDVAVVDEMADCAESLLGEVLMPCLADRNGRLILIGTVKGRNHFWRQFEKAKDSPEWFTADLKPADTNSLTDAQIQFLRAEMSEDEFRGEMLNDPDAGVRGSYYGSTLRDLEERGRIRAVEYDKNLLVDVSMDLGYADGTAVWYTQALGMREVRVLRFEEFTQTSFGEILRTIKRQPYTFGRFIGPHDLRVHDYNSGQSRLEFAFELGCQFEVAPQLKIMDGIAAGQRLLEMCWFDRELTKEGRDRLALYRSAYDERNRTLSRTPIHDWCSHAADAWRYLAVATGGAQADIWGSDQLKYGNNGAAYA